MAFRFMMFVDGSNLFGAGRKLRLDFQDYEGLFGRFFHACHEQWSKSFSADARPLTRFVRTYWYVVATTDDWDFENQRSLDHLRQRFTEDRVVSSEWAARAKAVYPRDAEARLLDRAWEMYLAATEDWYRETVDLLQGMSRFHHSLESSTDFIEIRRCGHWKLDMLRHRRDEKRVDTSFAVDMATMIDGYDVALLISGDADGIPSVEYVKNKGKQVGSIELIGGRRPEGGSMNFSSSLRTSMDFVTPIFEQELLEDGFARKRGESDR